MKEGKLAALPKPSTTSESVAVQVLGDYISGVPIPPF